MVQASLVAKKAKEKLSSIEDQSEVVWCKLLEVQGCDKFLDQKLEWKFSGQHITLR
jgi:hypothetical protein